MGTGATRILPRPWLALAIIPVVALLGGCGNGTSPEDWERAQPLGPVSGNGDTGSGGNVQPPPSDGTGSGGEQPGEPEPPVTPGTLAEALAATPEGGWLKANVNDFSSVWVPEELRPNMLGWGNPTPDHIISAWSSFAWDSNRGNLILYGGGHNNYRGNEVYIWQGSTRRWTRGSLPSASVEVVPGSLVFNAIDGAQHAPASAHTYDNSLFLPIVDRFITFGGASDNTGYGYQTLDKNTGALRPTGPYLFDPNRADPNKVGGTTGSHVTRVSAHPEIVGGNMWSNRESVLLRGFGRSYVEGCTGYAEENGKDVVYIHVWQRGAYKLTLHELDRPENDEYQTMGIYWGGPGNQTTCAYDPSRKAFVRTGTNASPFVFWNIGTPGDRNTDQIAAASDGTRELEAWLNGNAIDIAFCGLEFDSKRSRFALWCGDGHVWTIEPPFPLSVNNWKVTRLDAASGPTPNGNVGKGILGKWKYASDLDVFVGLQDNVKGNVWIYKPVGWKAP